MSDPISRRSILKSALTGITALSAVSVIRKSDAAALPALLPSDPVASSLGYATDTGKVDATANPTHKADQKCGNCVQFQGKPGDASGPCNIFAGKSVVANGWCRVWAKKPG
jgi:High potential iron-sulfur protein